MVDPVIQKIIDSRRKSIATLDEEIRVLESRAGTMTSPAARKVLLSQAHLKSQRRGLLQVELEALLAEQPELPGVASPAAGKPPAKR